MKEEVQKAMFLSLIADKSMDTSVSEQLILYLGYVDMASEEIVTHFASIRKIEGHSNVANLFSAADCILSELHLPREFTIWYSSTLYTMVCVYLYYPHILGNTVLTFSLKPIWLSRTLILKTCQS